MRSVIAGIGRSLRPLLLFEAGLAIVTLVLLDPLLVLLVERVVALGGDPFVGNTALIAFALSAPGATALSVAAIGSILAAVIAFGGTAVILRQRHLGIAVTQRALWQTLLARLPALLAMSGLVLGVAVLTGLPALATGLAVRRWWLSSGDIYFYIRTWPLEFVGGVAITAIVAAAGAAAAFVVLLRFSLAPPLCLLRGTGAGASLRESVRATRGRIDRLAPRMLAVLAGSAVLWMLTLAAFSGALAWLLSHITSGLALRVVGIGLWAAAVCVALTLAAVSRAAIALVPLADPASEAVLARRGEAFAQAARTRWPGPAFAALVCVAALAWAAGATVAAEGSPPRTRAVQITAHRAGSARAPENTIAALNAAIADGADFVEIDVQETADGQVVLLHDTDLRRVAGLARPVWQMSAAELHKLDVGAWFAPRFRGERIPTLREFAEAARGHVKLNVELKNNGFGEDLAARVAAILRQTGVARASVVSSLDLGLLRETRRVARELGTGLILATGIGDLGRVDVDFVALSRRLATPAVIRELHARGREVHVWTLDDEASIARAMLAGADNIITSDTPLAQRTRRWFESLSEPEKAVLRVVGTLESGWRRLLWQTGLPGGAAPESAAAESD